MICDKCERQICICGHEYRWWSNEALMDQRAMLYNVLQNQILDALIWKRIYKQAKESGVFDDK